MKNFVQVTKEEYAVNVIGLGIAVDLLSKISPYSCEDWAKYLAEQANAQLNKLSKETIEKIVSTHQVKGSKFKIEISRENNAGSN